MIGDRFVCYNCHTVIRESALDSCGNCGDSITQLACTTVLCGPCGGCLGLGYPTKKVLTCPKCRAQNVIQAKQKHLLEPIKKTNELIWLIRQYQKHLSPVLNRQCRFHPSCSEYSIRAIAKHGRLKGIAKTIERLKRCHPYNTDPALDLP